jgi:peptide/nickel transport system permease protein
MTRYIVVRVWELLGVLFAVSVITFLLMHAAPGGPYDEEMLLKGRAPEAIVKEIEAKYGLDRPLWEQYLSYVWRALHLDFGRSFVITSETVLQLIGRVWPVSIHLGLMTAGVAVPLGLALGVLAAIHRNTWVDYLTSIVAVGGFVLPGFVVGILLILTFSVWLRWLPTGGWDEPKQWIMPVMAYSLVPLARVARFTRSCVVEVMSMDYVRTARSKGLTERTVMLRHVLRNALIPLLTIAGPLLTDLITGSLFIEILFRVPGLGQFFTLAIQRRDYPLIMGTTLLWSALIGAAILLTDILYAWADPRIHLEAGGTGL